MSAQNTGGATATVADFFDEIDYWDPNALKWVPLAGVARTQTAFVPVVTPRISTGITLTVTNVPANGVTYPSSGDPIVGTTIGSGATAAWTGSICITLTAAQLNALFNAPKIRVERHVEDTPGDPSGESWTNDEESFNPLRSGFLNARSVVVTVMPPSGPSVQITSSTVPAFASLAPGASANYATTYRVPAPTSRGSSETEAAYLLRLTHLEGSSLIASASVTASGPTGPVSANAPPVTTIEHLPIVTIAKAGPATVTAGTTATYPLALNNAGGATASGIAIADTVPGGANGIVSGNPATLAPRTSSTGVQATFPVPVSQSSGNLTDTATVNWLDANGNAYGSLSSAFTTVVQNTLQGAKLTLALPPGSAGLNPVNGSQVVLISLVNGGGSPIPGQAVTVNVTGANPTALTATTDANGQATVTYSGKTQGVDQLQATASSASITVQSNTVSVTWIAPIEPVSTTPAQGTFFAESPSAQTFLAKPGDPAAFQQTFPTINFNPPANTIPHNVSGIDPSTRPFTDVTTDAVGNFAGTIVAQGNGVQAGVGTLTGFDTVLAANFIVSQPQDVTFNIVADDGFMLGVGGGASRVSGTLIGVPASGLTPFNLYQILGAYNQAGGAAPATYTVTIHFPGAGAYPYELDYFECCGAQLSLTMTVVSVNTGPYNLSTAYADTIRPAGTSSFPFPWNGSANTTFIGSGSPYDTGGLRFDNNTNQPITLSHVTVDIATHHYDPWNLNLTLPANGTLVLANPTGSTFDTSEAVGTGTTSGGGSGGFIAKPFATGFPNNGIGPVGVAFDNAGNLFAMDYATGFLYKFGPSGGVAGPATQVNANAIQGCPAGLAFSRDGKHLYLAVQCNATVLEIDQSTGTVIRTVASGIPNATGLATDPVSGDLFVSEPAFGHDDILRIQNPTSAAPTVAPYTHPGTADGIAFGPDGTLYASVCCSAVDIIAGTNATSPGTILTVIQNPALAGNDGIALLPPPPGAVGESIVVNSNNGFLVEIDNPQTPTPTFHNIVTGGSRGDFAAVGPDHCLYATQTDNVEKVTSTDGTCPFAPSICLTSPTVPQVHVTINGFTFDYNDSGLALTGGGIDGECTGNNESIGWQQIGGKGGPVNIPLPPAMTLALQAAPSNGHIVGQSQAFTVAAMDGAGHAVPNVAVQLGVSGANPQQLVGTTDVNGTATFSYTGSNAGTDTVTATAFVSGLRTVSNAVSILWTIPAPGGPIPGATGPAPPSVVINSPPDGSAVSQPVAITATIRAPPSSPISSWSVTYQNVSGGSAIGLASGSGNPPANLATFDPTGLAAGTYAITVNAATAAGGGASAVARVIVGNGGGTAGQAPPTISAPSPADGTIVTRPVPVTATITPPAGQTIASWSVSYQSQSQGTLVTILNGTGSPPATLATFDPTLLPNDTYAIVVTATASGGGIQTATTTVAVFGNLKLGRYVTSYQDLNVPVNGFQMQVKRIYDSIDKGVGDFGIGWHLDLGNFRVSANRQLGVGGWTEYPTSCIFGLCFYAFKTSTPHYMTVTFPDQHQEIFDFTPQGGAGILYWQGSAAFTARPGTGTTSTLAVAGDSSLSYDFAGNLVVGSGYFNPTRFKLTTHDGRVLILDTVSGLVSETDPNGNSLTIDSAGVHSLIAPAPGTPGPSLTFTRDSSNRIIAVTGPSGQHMSYGYSAAGDLVSYTDANTAVTTFTYDANHDLLSTTGAGRALSTLTYDSNGRLSSLTDGAGNTTRLTTNVAGRSMTVTDPAGQLTSVLTSDDLGDIIRVDRIAGGVTQTTAFTYDALGRPLSSTDPLGRTQQAAYDAQGNPIQYTDASGNVTKIAYNSFGQPTTITSADNTVSTYSYDSQGNVLSLRAADGSTVTYTYDGAGRVVAVADGLSRSSRVSYDANSHPSQITDPAGQTIALTQDVSGRLTSTTDPVGGRTSLTYDGVGNLTGVTDAAGHSHGFTYDALSQITSTADGVGGPTTYQYDGAGRVTQMVDRNGQTTAYGYDADGHLQRVSYPGSEVLTITYDGFGRATGVSNATSSISSTFDAASRLTSQTTTGPAPLGSVTTNYGYDAAGNRASMVGPDGTTSYAYDISNRLAALTDASGGRFTFTYDTAGRLATMARPNGVTDSFGYNAAGQITNQSSALGPTMIAQASRGYDTAARLSSLTEAAGTTTYAHDAKGQLTNVAAPGQPVASYAYDAAGNRTAEPGSGPGTLTHDANNRLLSDANYTYTYNAEGDRTSRTNRVTGGVTTYDFNARHQLLAVHNPDGSTTSYKYDPLGRRVQMSSGSQATSYVYDGANVHLEYNGSLLSAAYTDNLGIDQPLEMVRAGAASYYVPDGLGNVGRLTDPSGATQATYGYNAFGVPGTSTGTAQNPFTYKGREYDATSGLYNYRARYYEPQSGTFLSEDPLAAVNAYSFVSNNPLDLIDPTGTQAAFEYGSLLTRMSTALTGARAVGCGWGIAGAAVEAAVGRAVGGKLDLKSTAYNAAVGCIIGAAFPGASAAGPAKDILLSLFVGGYFLPFIAAFLGDIGFQVYCHHGFNNINYGHALVVGVIAAAIAHMASIAGLGAQAFGSTTKEVVAVVSAVGGGAFSGLADQIPGGADC